jgi:hypothetical protein
VSYNVNEELKFIYKCLENSYCDECTQTIDYDEDIKFIKKCINKLDYSEDCITYTKIESIYDGNTMDIGEEDAQIE